MGILCSVKGCKKSKHAKGYCSSHYAKFRRYGDPLRSKSASWGEPLAFIKKLIKESRTSPVTDCIPWPFATDANGYGRIQYEGEIEVTGRVICKLTLGLPFKLGLYAAHVCGNGHLGCVNPLHLYWATPSQNSQDRFDHGTATRSKRKKTGKYPKTK